MPYISGLNNVNGKLIIINEADWSVELNEDILSAPEEGYTKTVTSGTKMVVFRKTDGEITAYGNVTPMEEEEEEPEAWGTSYFDNTKWSASTGTWNGTYWESELVPPFADKIILHPDGGWYVGYRPSQMKITYESTVPNSIEFIDAGYSTILYTTDISSETVYNLNWSGQNMLEISFFAEAGNTFRITNIEFN